MAKLKTNSIAFVRSAIVKISLLCLLATVLNAQPQKRSIFSIRDGHPTKGQNRILLPVLTDSSAHFSPKLPNPGLDEDIWMEFNIDWTQAQIHRRGDVSPIELILPGAMNSNAALIWNLSATAPQPGGPPIMYFVEDIFSQMGPGQSTSIPLTWEYSLDGGPFTPMTLQPDNTLSAIFPAGQHSFEVRISGALQDPQDDGYYYLRLSQNILPQL